MGTIHIIYLAAIFVAVAATVLAILAVLLPRPTQKRLGEITEESELITRQLHNWEQRLVEIAAPFAGLSRPKEGWEESPLRIRFMNAGLRGQAAPILYFAGKSILAVLAPGVFLLSLAARQSEAPPSLMLSGLIFCAAIGYYLPNVVLAWRIRQRQREIFENFPDALDLMTVCVEAGLALDAAIARVGSEIALKSQTLGEEFHLVNLELRAGAPRERALRNLALRTGIEEIDALVAMLVQSDRFGTSIADALRVHADDLRTKRRLRAEEAAAKAPVKLLFPLIFCIFPALLLVLMGPAFISIYRILIPTMSGG